MGHKPKDRSARVKSMDALLAQSKRDSERPLAGKAKFEVRAQDATPDVNAEDPRGWLFSGRPPGPPEAMVADDLENAQFRVQATSTEEASEDPRGWLFSGRPDVTATPDSDQLQQIGTPKEISPTAPRARRPTPPPHPAAPPPPPAPSLRRPKGGVPSPVARVDLVKKRTKSSDVDVTSSSETAQQGASRQEEQAPEAQLAGLSASPDQEFNDKSPEQESAPVEALPSSQVSSPQVSSPESDASIAAASSARTKDSDPTVQVPTPSADDDDLHPDVPAFDFELPSSSPEASPPSASSRTPLLLAILLCLVGAAAAGWYLYGGGTPDRAETDAEERDRSGSRKVVAFAKRFRKSAPTPAPEQAPVIEPEVPPAQPVTEIPPMTPEQAAMSDDERFKKARYMRARGFRAIRQQKLDKAEESFRESLQLYPPSSVSLRGLGETLAAKGDTARARAWIERALRRNPEDKEARTLLEELQKE